MIVANFVLTYDMALPEGVSGRYPNLLFGSSVSFSNLQKCLLSIVALTHLL
jgi:hypothetical protein